MCIMSVAEQRGLLDRLTRRRALSVSSTRLFARREGDHQFLVYQMAIDAPSELAMVLPLPVSKIADDAIAFLDLSAVPTLFTQLAACFEAPVSRGGIQAMEELAAVPQTLVVHSVGSFEASWVPTLADMNRLDPRFRLADAVWRDLPQFADHGFAVFKLKAGAHTIHPMAMKFPTKDPALYFPTVHVHDGAVHRKAHFDHELYFQCEGPPRLEAPGGATQPIETAYHEARSRVNVGETRDAVAADLPLYRVELRGTFANADTRVRV